MKSQIYEQTSIAIAMQELNRTNSNFSLQDLEAGNWKLVAKYCRSPRTFAVRFRITSK
jgi:hypothetical protein